MNESTKLVEQYIPLANKLAFQRKKSLPKCIDIEELKSAAYLGLTEAANRFKPELGLSFTTFAYPRIRGAIIDYLRELGWDKRSNSIQVVSLDAPDDEGHSLADAVPAKAKKDEGKDVLDFISVRFGKQVETVLRNYFIDEMSMKEVGQKFGVSEGRISQLIKQYKDRIREQCDLCELAA
jgi:RNA polymerase sigma factor (sigma-70 family)